MRSRAFTLIELLIVVAIIAILAAIAVPNFLEAQVRTKISRAKADLRSISTAAEAYAVDAGTYPAGYKTAPLWGLLALSTPVAYITNSLPQDPFFRFSDTAPSRTYDYEAVSRIHRFLDSPATPFTDDPATPEGLGLQPVGYLLLSRGPDRRYGFRTDDPEYNLKERFAKRRDEPAPWLATIYDPTNGTVSQGNVTREGGSP